MQNFLKYFSSALIAVLAFASCQKADSLPFYESGKGSDLSLSTNTVTLSAANAAQNVVTFSWTDPGFATDTSNYKYVVEIAPKGTNFAKAGALTQIGGSSLSISGTQLNNMLVAWGIPFSTPTDFDVRLKASYANNNDMKTTPVTGLKVSSYPVAFTLSATATGPFSPTPLNKDNLFTKLSWSVPNYGSSTVSFAIEYAKAGTNFANPTIITLAKDSVTKSLTGMDLFQMANTAGIPLNTTGSVEARVKATVNGTNQVSYSNIQSLSISPVEMTLYMYLPGDYQSQSPYKEKLPAGNTWGWDPATAPRIASSDGVNYEGYIWVPAGGSGEFKMNIAPDWDHTNYGGTSTSTGGVLDASGGNLKWPATGAYYLVKVNMTTKAWTATKTDWGIIGAATPGGWGGSTPMTYDPAAAKWKITTTLTDGEFKFRANDGWDINLGGSPSNLTYGGGNISTTGGTKTILLDLSTPLKYTFSIQ